MRTIFATFLVVTTLTSVAAHAKTEAVPDWPLIPPAVSTALCQRLQMDALATGTVTIVNVTQPLITDASIAALRGTRKAKGRGVSGPFLNRALPVAIAAGPCVWNTISALEIAAHPDEMIVELSAPVANPFAPREAGVFARVSLGGVHPSLYWISLANIGGRWAVRHVMVLSR